MRNAAEIHFIKPVFWRQKTMKKNVGGFDKVFRIVAGLGVIAAGVYFQSWWGAVGLVPLFTAAIGWCPLYAPLGLSSHKSSGTDEAAKRAAA
jgi:hypothetical protein